VFVTLRQNDVTFGHRLGLVAAYRHAHELPRRAYRPKRSDSVACDPETVPPRPRNRPAIERLSGGDTGQLGSSPESTPGQRRCCPIVVVVWAVDVSGACTFVEIHCDCSWRSRTRGGRAALNPARPAPQCNVWCHTDRTVTPDTAQALMC